MCRFSLDCFLQKRVFAVGAVRFKGTAFASATPTLPAVEVEHTCILSSGQVTYCVLKSLWSFIMFAVYKVGWRMGQTWAVRTSCVHFVHDGCRTRSEDTKHSVYQYPYMSRCTP